ncbi:MAG TPA: cellulase family glycosylhydrolase, partial [Opitutaceae bacterium]|nr:cellulase family glycosylhydrolase [Opitutaceae bacterium]
EPNRVLVIGSNRWQGAATFPQLKVPAGDPNIILSVHDYEPFAFTHHTASWTHIRDYRGPVHYPGATIAPDDLAAIKDPALKAALRGHEVWDRARMLKHLRPAIETARKLHLQLYCGEFGCLPTVPRADRLAWYRDMISVFDEAGLAWANWEYKADFGIRSYNFARNTNGPIDQELIATLLSKPASPAPSQP